MSNSSLHRRTAFYSAPFTFVRRIMLRWLKGVFRSFDAGMFKYIDNGSTEINIYAAAPVEFEQDEMRPAIVYQRSPVGRNNTGFGAGPMVQSSRLSQDHQTKTMVVSGNLQFHCLSKVPNEAEDLAWVVLFWFSESITLITKTVGIFNLGNPVVGQVSPAPSTIVRSRSTEWSMCTCSIPFSFQYSWTSEPRYNATLEIVEIDLLDERDAIIQLFEAKKQE